MSRYLVILALLATGCKQVYIINLRCTASHDTIPSYGVSRGSYPKPVPVCDSFAPETTRVYWFR